MTSLFQEWPKMARLSRECVITEKIDGTNAQILITPRCSCSEQTAAACCANCPNQELLLAERNGLLMYAGSRTRMITPANDNAGFARWVLENEQELFGLGAGRHFGEWWGSKIARAYGQPPGKKFFSLFNTTRWADRHMGQLVYIADGQVGDVPRVDWKQSWAPACCHVVPELYRGVFSSETVERCLANLQVKGSVVAPGFMDPEGVVVYHTAANTMFKKTIFDDESRKSAVRAA